MYACSVDVLWFDEQANLSRERGKERERERGGNLPFGEREQLMTLKELLF